MLLLMVQKILYILCLAREKFSIVILLLIYYPIQNISSSNILADKAYGTIEIRNYIDIQNAKYTIPPKTNSTSSWYYDFCLYKECHLIECFFNKLKAFSGIITRYDKLATSFLTFIYVASIFILSKQYNILEFSNTL